MPNLTWPLETETSMEIIRAGSVDELLALRDHRTAISRPSCQQPLEPPLDGLRVTIAGEE